MYLWDCFWTITQLCDRIWQMTEQHLGLFQNGELSPVHYIIRNCFMSRCFLSQHVELCGSQYSDTMWSVASKCALWPWIDIASLYFLLFVIHTMYISLHWSSLYISDHCGWCFCCSTFSLWVYFGGPWRYWLRVIVGYLHIQSLAKHWRRISSHSLNPAQ